ncbi:hypothetical protein G7046_g7403 [Stylonectria norvegica]|nr:hypothetical protein G7046_g7403 [Stylonectria norvegica]
MASASTGGTMPPNFLLTPQQQNLLFAALNSNKQQQQQQSAQSLPQLSESPLNGITSLSPTSFQSSPMQQQHQHQPKTRKAGYQESPYLDSYDYDFGDSSFDFSFANAEDQAKMIGDIPTAQSDSTENEGNEKRNHPDDEDDEESPGNDPKRRESGDKVPKKPGRKPLTSEPSSVGLNDSNARDAGSLTSFQKRKAQNRAAQRAFRERKERHLKDLETKVEELEKASEAANHENEMLRTRVETMTTELLQYKQKVTLMTNPKAIPREKVPFGNAAVNNLSDVNFQFEFPKFGMLPGIPVNKPQRSISQPISPQQHGSAASPIVVSPKDTTTKSPQTQHQILHDAQFKDDMSKFTGIFSPSMSSSATNVSRGSLDSGNYSVGPATSSPSSSSHSNTGPSSSCGTSPEPFTQSPMGFKPVDMLTTIGEEQPIISTADQPFAQFAHVDVSSTNFDWLAHQNGGQFDPQLYGDYREPQENILSNTSFDDFFNETVDPDFFTPYNMPTDITTAKELPHKKTLIDEIDAQQESVEEQQPLKNCNQLWYDLTQTTLRSADTNALNREKLQNCPKAQNGEFDLDGLCSELTKKAKCSGTGPVVGETDFDTILKKYMGEKVSSNCMAEKLGIELSDDKARPLPSA